MTTGIVEAVYSHVEPPREVPAASAGGEQVHQVLAQALSDTSERVLVVVQSATVGKSQLLAALAENDEWSSRESLVAFDSLRVALHTRIHEDDGLVAVEDIATGIFGSGDTVAAAILDLRNALAEHLEVLSEDPDLSAGLLDQLSLLRSYFTNP
jgi:hypothetical protein